MGVLLGSPLRRLDPPTFMSHTQPRGVCDMDVGESRELWWVLVVR